MGAGCITAMGAGRITMHGRITMPGWAHHDAPLQ